MVGPILNLGSKFEQSEFFPISFHGNQSFEWNLFFFNKNERRSHKDHFCKVCTLATNHMTDTLLICIYTNFIKNTSNMVTTDRYN